MAPTTTKVCNFATRKTSKLSSLIFLDTIPIHEVESSGFKECANIRDTNSDSSFATLSQNVIPIDPLLLSDGDVNNFPRPFQFPGDMCHARAQEHET